jgi:hypothetical protein
MVCAYLGFWNEKQSIILFSTISKFQDEKELWENGKRFFFFFERFAADLLRLRPQTADPGQK